MSEKTATEEQSGDSSKESKEQSEDSSKILNYLTNSVFGNKDATISAYSVAGNKNLYRYKTASSKEEGDAIDSTVERLKAEQKTLAEALTAVPTTAGADYYKTINEGIKNLKGLRENNNEKLAIVIYGSGLSDSGKLNFADSKKDLLHREPEKIVEMFKAEGEITESIEKVSNLSIIWYNIGETSAPQDELSRKEKDNLKNIYTEIFRTIYGAEISFKDVVKNGDNIPEYIYNVKATKVNYGLSCGDEISVSFAFNEGSDTFVNEDEAKEKLDNLASSLKTVLKNPICGDIEIKAYAVNPGNRWPDETIKELSQDRADRVKKELIKRGPEESRLIAKGMGLGSARQVTVAVGAN